MLCRAVRAMNVNIKIKRLNDLARMPTKTDPGSAGWDICACTLHPIVIDPSCRVLIPTGLSFEFPEDWEMQVRPRSGNAYKYGISIPNTPATIDSSFRGELQVILINHGDKPFVVEHGHRIAQLLFAQVPQVTWEVVDSLSETSRGSGGLGSSGV